MLPYIGFEFIAVTISVGFFAAMLLLLEIGRRIGIRQMKRYGPDSRIGVGVADAAVYGLLALLMGFTFSGAAIRFDHRREIVARTANAIGTAWMRVDLLPAEAQGPIRDGFRRFLDALLEWYSRPTGTTESLTAPPPVTRAQADIWAHVVAATVAPSGERARLLLVPSVNAMFDTVEEERLARRIHPPIIIFMMLGVTALTSALLAGYGVASRSTHNWIFTIAIAATVATAIYVIVELEYPRAGLIRVDEMDQALAELRATM